MLKFEWDENKRQVNIEKHGIDFEDVNELFNNKPLVFVSPNKCVEERFIAIGKIKDVVVTVIFTPRKNNIRIISIRKARKNERKLII